MNDVLKRKGWDCCIIRNILFHIGKWSSLFHIGKKNLSTNVRKSNRWDYSVITGINMMGILFSRNKCFVCQTGIKKHNKIQDTNLAFCFLKIRNLIIWYINFKHIVMFYTKPKYLIFTCNFETICSIWEWQQTFPC